MSTERKPAATTAGLKRRAPTLYIIVWFKILKGLFGVLLATALYREAEKDMPADLQKLIDAPAVQAILHYLRVHPENKFFIRVSTLVDGLTATRVHHLALATLIWSVIPLIEGVGMQFRAGWAGWLAIGESAFFIPIECYELTNPRASAWFVLSVMIVNIIIVWYLYVNRNELFHHFGSRRARGPKSA